MNSDPHFPNLALGWTWLLLGFFSGMLMGLFFHRENWLGGYGSFRRRMYRLAHISFFGLGTVNLLFYFTSAVVPGDAPWPLASWSFMIGALTMPAACLLMAHRKAWLPLFGIPVTALCVGAVSTLIHLFKS